MLISSFRPQATRHSRPQADVATEKLALEVGAMLVSCFGSSNELGRVFMEATGENFRSQVDPGHNLGEMAANTVQWCREESPGSLQQLLETAVRARPGRQDLARIRDRVATSKLASEGPAPAPAVDSNPQAQALLHLTDRLAEMRSSTLEMDLMFTLGERLDNIVGSGSGQ